MPFTPSAPSAGCRRNLPRDPEKCAISLPNQKLKIKYDRLIRTCLQETAGSVPHHCNKESIAIKRVIICLRRRVLPSVCDMTSVRFSKVQRVKRGPGWLLERRDSPWTVYSTTVWEETAVGQTLRPSGLEGEK